MFRVAAVGALAASGLIALSSCASGQPSPAGTTSTAASTRPTAAQRSSPGPVAGDASIAATASRSTPSVRVALLTEVFATPLPADPVQARVIEGFREAQILWDQATEERHMVPFVTAYVTGKAFANLTAAVTSGAKDFVALGGTDRLYDTTVTSVRSASATVTSCDDGSRTNLVDLATGQKIPNNPGTQLTYFVIWQLAPVSGHWAITSLNVISAPDARAKACLTS